MAISPVFVCGFECGVDIAHWTLGATPPTFATASPISGARSLRCNPSNQSNCNATSIASFGVGLLVVRFKVKFTVLPDAGLTIFHLGSNAGTGVFYGNAAIKGIVNNFETALNVPVIVGVAYTIDVKIDRRANPWTIDLQVNGVPVDRATAAEAAVTTAQQVVIGMQQGFGAGVTADALFDDVVISTTEADYPIGPGYVNHFVPTTDGTHNIAGADDFERGNTGTDITNATTTAFQLIDDVPLPGGTVDEADNIRAVAPPNSTDYTECVFGPAPGVATPTVAPRGVEVVLAHHQIATQTGQMVVELNDNGTINTVFDTGAAAGVVTYRYARKHYAAGPAGAWVIGGGGNGDFTDLRVRFRAPDATPDQCLDAVMIEAEFKGPLFTKQALQPGDVVEVADSHTDVPDATSYDLGTDVTETADTVVTTVISASTAEGEVPQQQCVIESQGGGDVGVARVDPKLRVHARMSVTVAGTDAGMSGLAS